MRRTRAALAQAAPNGRAELSERLERLSDDLQMKQVALAAAAAALPGPRQG